ncbi:putative glycosyl transferase [compost metagenome]
MAKTVWLINQYASTLDYGFGGRFYYFANELAKKGYDVHVFASGNHHLLKKKPNLDSLITTEIIEGFKFHWIKCLDYPNAHSKKRIFSEFDFSKKISNLNIDSKNPDCVIYSTPSLIGYTGASKLSKKLGSKLILDIRDLWPLTLIEMGVSKYHPFIMYLSWLEKKAYNNSDYIISNWPYANNYINKFNDKINFKWIPNGFSLEEFKAFEKLDQATIDKIPKNKFIVGYCGTVGFVNALETLIQSAEILKENTDISFLIVGSGKEKEIIQQYAKDKNCNNVVFIDAVNKKQVPHILSFFDCCYVGFMDIPLYNYGSSLTKLPEYLASKKPIVYASNSPFQPVLESNSGISTKAEDPKEISEAILQLYNISENERKKLGENAYNYAKENYEYQMLGLKLINVIKSLT